MQQYFEKILVTVEKMLILHIELPLWQVYQRGKKCLVSFLTNLNINLKNGVAYKKTCSEPQIQEAIQDVFILIYRSEIYP